MNTPNWYNDTTTNFNTFKPERHALQIAEIRRALGEAYCTRDNPCGAEVHYDHDEPLPWRIADDWISERYESFDQAIAAARHWNDSE
ncbi:MAG: hypothetical protein OES79_14610 [Planctomycetota bacterium]|nr:hypothetical protein [Planctomycetota bacterium]